MKRVHMNSPQSGSMEEEARVKLKYQSLLNDYLQLKNEVEDDKKTLQMMQVKKRVLIDEVGFLRHRLRYLQQMQSVEEERLSYSQQMQSPQHKRMRYMQQMQSQEQEQVRRVATDQNKGCNDHGLEVTGSAPALEQVREENLRGDGKSKTEELQITAEHKGKNCLIDESKE